MVTAHAFCRAIFKGIEGSEWGELYDYHKEMGRAAAPRKPNESHKSESPLENERGKGSGEFFCDPQRKDNILERNKTRLELWEEHLKDPIVALDRTPEWISAGPTSSFMNPMLRTWPCKSSGRTSQAMWWRFFSRIASLGGWL